MTEIDPFDLADRAAAALRDLTGVDSHDVALVLGSGWLPAIDSIGTRVAEVDAVDLPGFRAAGVAGHAGRILSLEVDGVKVLAFCFRSHLYEGRGVRAVVHPIRTAAAAGCRAIVLTNGAGGIDESWTPGTPVLIKDHLNLTATSPVEGADFIDLTDLYSARLRAVCHEIDPSLAEGVYAQFRGPHYETPAEIAMVRAVGGHLVGMSTALEAIAARQSGLEVLGISLVTNLAAGVGGGAPLGHDEVLAAGQAASARMGTLLATVIPRI